jgi:uncharacterized protein (DUF1800 family)
VHDAGLVDVEKDMRMTETSDTRGLLGSAAAVSVLLSACGGGGGDSAATDPGNSPVSPPPTSSVPSDAEAARFLAQAAFAATDGQIARVKALGYSAWLDEQWAAPRSMGHFDWLADKGYAITDNINSFAGADNTLWRKLIGSPDALRQRMVLALSEIFVVSMAGLPVAWRSFVLAHTVDLLETHAFGTYRELLEAVTLSPGMGVYLNMRGNRKADPASGRVPDENYAREVLQLFSLGLVALNADGTPQRDAAGNSIETYNQDTITGLARVFTGWDYDGFSRTEPGHARRPMVNNASQHETGAKTFLGVTVPAGSSATASLKQALDTIASHPNVGPFIGRQLIQRLVTSNPSPAYVARVAAAFNDNGQGVRGDFKAVLKAILLDSEARRAPSPEDTTRGMLREPVARFIQWARTFGVSSPTDLWNAGNLSDPATRLGQSPLRSPSVFNFFRPGYVPPNSALGALGITAPEFQITNESTVIGWANFAQTFVVNGVGELRPDYSAERALAADAAALVRRVALLLTGDSLPASSRDLITQAVSTLPATTESGRNNRVYAAVHLVLCSPEYLVQV